MNKQLKLKSASVYRKGETSRGEFNKERTEIKLIRGFDVSNAWGLKFEFLMASKGGGRTVAQVKVGSGDFPAMIDMMVAAERRVALEAMTSAIHKEVCSQATVDRNTLEQGRRSVVDEARRALNTAPADKNLAEKLTYDMVQRLVQDLNDRDKNQPVDTFD